MGLTLFPVRSLIGRLSGTDVLMTQEFARFLADLFERVGGSNGVSNSDLKKELARRPSTLAQSASAANLTGTTELTVLASVNVPANAMGASGLIRITTTWSVTNNENNKNFITKFGGADISRNAVTTVSTFQEQQVIQNRTATQQVFVFGGFSYTGAPISSLSKDTALGQTISIAAQLDNPGDSITLEAYTVELIPTP